MPKRTLQGVVVSDKQAKTVVVRVDRRFTHPIYKKTIRRSKNYHAHDEKGEFKPGRVIFEIDGVTVQTAKEALSLAAAKLPIKTRFVARIAE
jgi:small subunit ribosomal protein S17